MWRRAVIGGVLSGPAPETGTGRLLARGGARSRRVTEETQSDTASGAGIWRGGGSALFFRISRDGGAKGFPPTSTHLEKKLSLGFE